MSDPVVPEDPPPFDPVGVEAAFVRFRPAALAFDGPIHTINVDANLAVQNARTGVANVLRHRERIEAETRLSVEAIATVPAIGEALLYVTARVDRYAAAPGEVRELRSRCAERRSLLLVTGEALALGGWLPRERIEQIRKGRGPIDAAEDCVALGALFRDHWATISDKVGFDQGTVEETSALGSQLLLLLRPRGAAEPADTALDELTDLRDRFWSLFSHTWEWQVWRAGAHLWARAVDDSVPPLLSRVVPRRAVTAEVPPSGSSSESRAVETG